MELSSKITKHCERLIKLRLYSLARDSLVKYINSESSNKASTSEAYALLTQIDLIQGDLPKAQHHISRSLFNNRENTMALMSKAYVYIVEQDSEEALRTYFKISDLEPTNKLAKQNVERIKKTNITSKLTKRPPARKYLIYSRLTDTMKYSLVACFMILTVILTYLSVNVFYPMIELRFFDIEQRQLRERLNNFYLFDGLEDTQAQGTQSVTYSPKQASDMFEETKKHMIKGDINSAIIVINTALASDINIYLKEQFERLSAFIIAPNYNALKNNITYTSLIENPSLYTGGFVKWTAHLDSFERVRNDDGDEEIMARVVVLSSSDDISEGIAMVAFDVGTQLTKNERLEIYGRIEGFNSQRKIPVLRSLVVKHLPQRQ